MAKPTSKHVCSECGYESVKWLGKCLGCGTFGTMVEEQIEVAQKSKSAIRPVASSVVPQRIVDIKEEKIFRYKSGLSEFDTVLGGGIVPRSLVLIGGDPGIGKSTLLSQILGNLSKEHECLYVSAEESSSQVKMRFMRLGYGDSGMQIINENCLEEIEGVIASDDFKFVVIDSIQAIYLSSMTASSGSVSQVKECANRLMRLAKSGNTTIFIIGHVTKDGAIAGPKVLEHIMDSVLYFEGDENSSFKILRAVKNRFGSTNEVGIFDMTENGICQVNAPSQILLSENSGTLCGSVVAPVIEGSRCMLVEIQALTASTSFGMPRRMSSGIDYNKFVLMLAVLEKKGGISLYNQDAYINVMGGLKIYEPAVDLAIAAAVLSSVKNQPAKEKTAYFGEIGLTGEIRPVFDAEKRVSECVKMGYEKVVLPHSNALKLRAELKGKIDIIPVKYISHLIGK